MLQPSAELKSTKAGDKKMWFCSARFYHLSLKILEIYKRWDSDHLFVGNAVTQAATSAAETVALVEEEGCVSLFQPNIQECWSPNCDLKSL